jgi:hypothetical protein
MRELLEALSAEELVALLNHVGAGIFNARHAGQCVTDGSSPQHRTVLQLLAYLSEAIRELEAARAIVVEQTEGGVGA